MPRVYDTFVFYNELDILECRLRELEDAPVYRHVLVESPLTFQGKPKPMYFADNQERFAPWSDRIIHVIAEIDGDEPDQPAWLPWAREAAQREAISAGLKDAGPDDVILVSDVDEIPRASTLRDYLYVPMTLLMDHYMFAVDWRHPELWRGTTVAQMKNITSFESARRARQEEGNPLLANSGWHFSYLGGPGAIQDKARAFSHTEATDLLCQGAEDLYRQGRGMDVQLDAVDIDSTFPRWIQERECPQNWFRP